MKHVGGWMDGWTDTTTVLSFK